MRASIKLNALDGAELQLNEVYITTIGGKTFNLLFQSREEAEDYLNNLLIQVETTNKKTILIDNLIIRDIDKDK